MHAPTVHAPLVGRAICLGVTVKDGALGKGDARAPGWRSEREHDRDDGPPPADNHGARV
jgi:hypothetical protein